MLSEDGNPTFHSLTSVLDTLGLQMEIAPRQSPQMALSAVGQVSASHEITTNELQAPWKEQPGLLERLTPARRSQVARPDIFEYAH